MASSNNSDSSVIRIGSRVSVLWQETGTVFLATVIGIYVTDEHCGQQYDIEYDEEVCGRRIHEKHVASDRISRNVSQSDRGEEDRYAEIFENMSTCGGRYLHATSGKDLLAKLISLKEDEDEEDEEEEEEEPEHEHDDEALLEEDVNAKEGHAEVAQEQDSMDSDVSDQGQGQVRQTSPFAAASQAAKPKLELSPKQFLMLNDALYEQQIYALIAGSRRTLRFITEQLTTAITQELQAAPNFEEQYMQWHAAGGNDGDTDAAQWLSPGQEGGKLLTQCRSTLAAASALMRILSCHMPGLDVAPIDEDHIERCVRWVAAVMLCNCGASPLRASPLDPSRSKASRVASTSSRSKQDLSASGAASSRASAKAHKEVLGGVQKVLQEVGASVLPLVKSTLDTLEVLLNARRQPDRLCIAAYELGLCTLRAEPSCSSRAELVASANSYPLQSVHAASINLLQTMGCKYPTHRTAILSEIVLLMATTLSGRVVGRTFPVHFSVHATVKHEKGGASKSGSSAASYGSYASAFSSAGSQASSGHTPGGSVNDRYVSTSFACLLLFIQSAAGAESAQSLLGESQRLCKGVVADLLHRATHKDMGMEYRLLTTSLLQQIETALSSPLLPVCAMLLDSLLSKVMADLFTMAGEKPVSDRAARDKNGPTLGERGIEQGYINFLLDLVGSAGQVLRCVVLGGARTAPGSSAQTVLIKNESKTPVEDKSSLQATVADKSTAVTAGAAAAGTDADIDPRVLRALKLKLQKKEVEWLARKRRPEAKNPALGDASEEADDLAETAPCELNDPDEVLEQDDEQIMEEDKENVRSSRRNAAKTKTGPSDDIFNGGSFSIEQTLRILGEVTTVTLDAIAEYEQVNFVGSFETATPSKKHTDFGAEPLTVLKQAGCLKILALLAPSVQAVDVSRHLICEYMRSIAVNTGADGTAYSTILSLWYKDCIDTNRVEVAGYVERRLRAVPLMLQQQRELADRNAVTPTVVTGPQADFVSVSKATRATSSDINIGSALIKAESTPTSSSSIAPETPLWETRMSFEWVQRNYHVLLAEWFGIRQYESIVALLLNLLASEQSPLLRARAIKTINVLFQTDAGLIARQPVCRAVTRRLNDTAICVREETVKLIGCYVLQLAGESPTSAAGVAPVEAGATTSPATSATDEYLDGLLLRLRDRGVSVRKAVVLLLRELLLRQLSHPRYSELCLSLLERSALPKEEESIKDTVRATFTELWLTIPKHKEFEREGAKPRSASAPASGAGVIAARRITSGGSPRSAGSTKRDAFEIVTDVDAAQLAPDQLSPASSLPASVGVESSVAAAAVSECPTSSTSTSPRRAYLEQVAMQIVDVLSTSVQHLEAEASTTLTSLLHEALHGRKDGDEESAATLKRREQSVSHCAELVRALMEIVLKLEEHEPQLQRLYAHRRSREAQLVSTIATISVFCSAHPPLLVPHMSALLPYLKPHGALSAQQHSDVTLTVCRMLASVAVIHDTQGAIHQSVPIAELNADLTSIALSGGYQNVDAAIRCLAAVAAHISADVKPFMQLASKCFTAVQRAAASLPDRAVQKESGKINVNISPQLCARVQRCLIVLGAACEHSTLCSQELMELTRRTASSTSTSPREARGGDVLSKLGKGGVPSPTSVTSAANLDDATPSQPPPQSASRHISHGSLHSVGSLAQLETSAISHKDRCAVEEAAACMDLGSISAMGPDTLNGCTHAAAVFALTLPDEGCEVRAVQALCRVYIGCPKLVTLSHSHGILSRLLSDAHTPLLHQKLLGSLNHMMQAEERRLEGGHTLRDMRSAGVSVGETVLATASERDSDVSVTAAAVLANLRRLTDFLYSADAELRSETLDLLGTLLRQGMLCPLDVIAHLVALQADPQEDLRGRALRILQAQDDKYGTFVDNRLLDGLEAAYTLSLRCGTLAPNGTPFPARRLEIRGEDGALREVLSVSVFSALYKTMIQPSKTRRPTVVTGILKRISVLMQSMSACRTQLFRALEYRAMHAGNAGGEFVGSSTSTSTRTPSTPAEALAVELTSARITLQGAQCGEKRTSSGQPAGATPASPAPAAVAPDLSAVLKQLSHLQGAALYLTATLAHLPYESAAEPLQIIQWITRNAPVDASILCKSVSTQAPPMGVFVPASADAHAHGSPPPVSARATRRSEASAAAAASTSADLPPPQAGQARMSVRAVQASLEAREAEAEAHALTLNDAGFQKWFSASELWASSSGVASEGAMLSEAASSDASMLATLLSGGCEARCREGLLRLKGFLKASYHLSSERCHAYIAHTMAKEGRAASEIIRTCDDANSGGKMTALTQDFSPVPPSACPNVFATSGGAVGAGPVKLIQCLTSAWPPAYDGLAAAVRACVGDIGRLSCSAHADEDLTPDSSHRLESGGGSGGGGASASKKRKAAPRKSAAAAAAEGSGGSTRKARRVSPAAADSDSDAGDDESEGGEEEDKEGGETGAGEEEGEFGDEGETSKQPAVPRVSSSGRKISAPVRLSEAAVSEPRRKAARRG